jgi:hypothetical protein
MHDSDFSLNVYVSLDGTRKRRGHVSRFGIVYSINVDPVYCY